MTQTSNPRDTSALAEAHILIVEDSALMRDLLYTCLKAFEVPKVVAVETPMECLDELGNQAFDALIVDWRLKDHDGLALIRQIRRELPDPLCRVPIVLCTGYSDLSRVLEARDSGINEMLCKPVSPKALYSKLKAAMACDRMFMMTEAYVGPERRALPRGADFEGFCGADGNPADAVEDLFV